MLGSCEMGASRAFVLFAVLLACCAAQVAHVHFVDESTASGNMLFRGGSPEPTPGNFSFTGLVASIKAAAKAVGKALPGNARLLVINVENIDDRWMHKDGNNVIAEKEFFDANPDKGSFVFWYTHGTLAKAAESILQPQMAWLARSFPIWGPDYLHIRTPQLRSYLTTPTATPTVIYLHCDCGCDRTGEAIGSYMMQYMNMSYINTCKLNNHIAGRPQMCSNQHAMQWYCEYLKSLGVSTVGNCLQFSLCTPEVCETDRRRQ